MISVTRRVPLCSCTTSDSIPTSSLSGASGEKEELGLRRRFGRRRCVRTSSGMGFRQGAGAIGFVDYLTEALDKTSDGSPGIVVLEDRPSRRNDRPN